MRRKSLGVLALFTLVLASCGGGDSLVDVDDDDPILKIVSEGGFLPVEVALNNGPRYMVLGDGRLIFQGVQTMEFPGDLVPPYLVSQLDENQMNAVLAMVDDIGLPDMDHEIDDSAAAMVADASSEVITYWDAEGEHQLSVYALGIAESPSARNAAFLELINTFDRFTSEAPAEPYVPDRVRIVGGTGFIDPQFEDTRPWPLEETDLSEWKPLPNGWQCTTLEGPVPDVFADATQTTTWEDPAGGDPLQLLVRPLLPGETPCP